MRTSARQAFSQPNKQTNKCLEQSIHPSIHRWPAGEKADQTILFFCWSVVLPESDWEEADVIAARPRAHSLFFLCGLSERYVVVEWEVGARGVLKQQLFKLLSSKSTTTLAIDLSFWSLAGRGFCGQPGHLLFFSVPRSSPRPFPQIPQTEEKKIQFK